MALIIILIRQLCIRDQFLSGRPVIGICAAAIMIRAIGGHTENKHLEAPVLAMSEDGAVVIPFIGGHHGGNDLARIIAEETGGTAAVTTAGDRQFDIALDHPPAPFCLADIDAAKPVMAALIAGRRARLEIDLPPGLDHLAASFRAWLEPVLADDADHADHLTIRLGLAPAGGTADLDFHPRILHLGLGASRGCPHDEMAALVAAPLAAAGLSPRAIAGVYSLDLQADEGAILELAASLGVRLGVFDAARLEQETHGSASPRISFLLGGLPCVAEGAALLPDLRRHSCAKKRDAHATMAAAIDPTGAHVPQDCRHRGKVMLVGIGRGNQHGEHLRPQR